MRTYSKLCCESNWGASKKTPHKVCSQSYLLSRNHSTHHWRGLHQPSQSLRQHIPLGQRLRCKGCSRVSHLHAPEKKVSVISHEPGLAQPEKTCQLRKTDLVSRKPSKTLYTVYTHQWESPVFPRLRPKSGSVQTRWRSLLHRPRLCKRLTFVQPCSEDLFCLGFLETSLCHFKTCPNSSEIILILKRVITQNSFSLPGVLKSFLRPTRPNDKACIPDLGHLAHKLHFQRAQIAIAQAPWKCSQLQPADAASGATLDLKSKSSWIPLGPKDANKTKLTLLFRLIFPQCSKYKDPMPCRSFLTASIQVTAPNDRRSNRCRGAITRAPPRSGA